MVVGLCYFQQINRFVFRLDLVALCREWTAQRTSTTAIKSETNGNQAD